MSNETKNTLRIYAKDRIQLYSFLRYINVPGWCGDLFRSAEVDEGEKVHSAIKFTTAWEPPHKMYEVLHQIAQSEEFEGLQFEATFLDEADEYTVLYRWIPGKPGPVVVTDEEERDKGGVWPSRKCNSDHETVGRRTAELEQGIEL
jgi:hypothetical protein